MVIQRMEERILLLKGEVEGRGFKWVEDESRSENVESNGHARVEEATGPSRNNHGGNTRPSGGRLGDEELAQRLREQMEYDDDEAQDGVHL